MPTIVLVLANSASVALSSNAACNPFVLAIVKLLSVIVACLPSIADCNPFVFAIVNPPSAIVACTVVDSLLTTSG